MKYFSLLVVAVVGIVSCARHSPPKCHEDRPESEKLSSVESKALANSVRKARNDCSAPNVQCGYGVHTRPAGEIDVSVDFAGISESGQCVYVTGAYHIDSYDKNGTLLGTDGISLDGKPGL